MKINIKATNLDLTPEIREYLEEKIGSLSRFLKKFETKSEIEIFIEIAQTTKHRQGNILYAEATIPLGKKILRAEHFSNDIKIAINKVKDELQREIKEYKEKKFLI